MSKKIFLAGCICFLITAVFGQRITPLESVQTRKNATDSIWITYQAKTVDNLSDFTKNSDPEYSSFGGWKIWKKEATGFYRTEKVNDRWWIIDPEGYPFIHRAVVAFTPSKSLKQKEIFDKKYGTNENWIKKESVLLRKYGFNGAGAWSNTDELSKETNTLAYTILISPMSQYRKEHIKQFGGKYEESGWQGYRFDLAMVFDKEFDKYIQEAVKPLGKYENDPHLLGYFTDNELPWMKDALDRHLTLLAKDEQGYLAAKKWLDERKGHDADITEITDEDRQSFTGYYFETYMKKMTSALRKVAPNHMYLGCRFNQERNQQELSNPEIFRVAGKYMDIISINHYRKWEPLQRQMDDWGEWSGKPFLITEWYTKAEDSNLPNNTGAGWLVKTQRDRGLFYQNFTIELLKNKNCVGWHWFKYMDNDPDDLTTDPSNRDSNKGIVDRYFNPYVPLLENMKKVNDNAYNLIQYFNSQQKDVTQK